jgi:hypothetical protein
MLDRRQFLVTALGAQPAIACAIETATAQTEDLPPAAISLAGVWRFALDAKSQSVAGAPESYGERLRCAAGDVTTRSKAIILNETPAAPSDDTLLHAFAGPTQS